MRHSRSLLERFNEKYIISPDGCWLWTASVGSWGYGQILVDGRPQGAHRISYKLHVGPIPKGLCVCHACDVRLCVNPDHFWLGTRADNQADMATKGRAAKGVMNGQAKLTEFQVLEIRIATGTLREIAAQYGISDGQVSNIKTRKLWRHFMNPGGATRKGEHRGNSKLTETQVLEIRADTGLLREIAPRYSISQATVSMIKNRKA